MKHSKVRHTIIETASKLFYTKGYNLTGINEVIAESGIAKATLYNHFKSKDDLCVAYLEHRNTAFLVNINGYVNSVPEGDSKILALFGFLKTFFNEDGFNGCWCINTIAEIPEDNVLIRSEIQEQKKGLITFIEGLVTERYPKMTAKENLGLTQQIYVLYEGAVAESNLHNAIWPVEAAESICKAILS